MQVIKEALPNCKRKRFSNLEFWSTHFKSSKICQKITEHLESLMHKEREMIHGRMSPMKSAKTYKKRDLITLTQGKRESLNRK